MKTKIGKLLVMILATSLLLFACSKDFLNTSPQGAITQEQFYKTDADATGAIMACYNMLMFQNAAVWSSVWMLKATLSDEIYTGGQHLGDQAAYDEINFYKFGSNNTVISDIYRYFYMTIYRANVIIDNFQNPTAYQKIVIAEAKTIRAYQYLELVSLYGPVPLVIHPLTPSTYAQPNSTVSAIYQQIDKDLTEAIADLPVKSQLAASGSDVSRVSKGTAQALLGKARLYNKDYAGAITAFQPLVDPAQTEYSLYQLSDLKDSDLTQLFRKSTDWGKESLFEIDYSSARGNTWANANGDLWNNNRTNTSNLVWQLCGPRGDEGFNGGKAGINGGWGFGYPTISLYKAYVAAGDSVREHAFIMTEKQLVDTGGSLRTNQSGKNWQYPWECPGMIRLKYTTWADETVPSGGTAIPYLNYSTNLRIIRYSDVLLMAAEAYLMAGQAASALPLINKVRERVKLPDLAAVTLDDIKTERRLELSFEGVRFQDLIRWGDAPTVLADQAKQIPTGQVVNGALQFQAVPGAGFKSNNTLLPIPFNEISSNPQIKQNPGY